MHRVVTRPEGADITPCRLRNPRSRTNAASLVVYHAVGREIAIGAKLLVFFVVTPLKGP